MTSISTIEQLDLVKLLDRCDSFHNNFISGTIPFYLNDAVIGYIIPEVIQELVKFDSFVYDWIYKPGKSIQLNATDFEKRSSILEKILKVWKQSNLFGVADQWRNELYSVFGPNGEVAFAVERGGYWLFGFVSYGVHCNIYVPPTPTTPMCLWVPTRSSTKQTWPGYLDNSVAGGISHGDSIVGTMVKECLEEANLSVSHSSLRSRGIVSYIKFSQKKWYQPELQYVFDVPIDENTKLRPNDGEVAEFHLWTLDQVIQELAAGNFKPNCALVILDFLMRHGILSPEHPQYYETFQRIHRNLPHPIGKYKKSKNHDASAVSTSVNPPPNELTESQHFDPCATWSERLNERDYNYKYAILILNRSISISDNRFHHLWDNASLRICADGGSNRLKNYDPTLKPDILVGDFDSLTNETREHYKRMGVQILHDPDQYSTDFMKAQKVIQENGISVIFTLCGMDGRVDHALGNLNHLYWSYAKHKETQLYILSEANVTWLLPSGESSINCGTIVNKHCGILPVGRDAFVLRTDGLKWNLENQVCSFGGLISSCNIICKPQITVLTQDPVIWTMEAPDPTD
ncbi:thiamine diphosphokinase Tnr3 [Schizosaccharomyces cryophilus OY26]|uniref:Thiamine diphosphokinase Tnr3 n=1 Tax=Schizosaccharomyces cryophilus (strain OY26 / ATCC MYA-4695 / CBS 11777 / NBRC 106824 / NRRL Y48691) TaxID=653667 RepID=S9VXJ6_SCHCR|nr:thiamine diphosphokinase Tnr3 [Schizosaccharomyces cryophilus OY26]EPY50909.1 thiamine diphosphokinase Tnr3 [Schizosaccharomyces cryophilus OY26]